MISSTNHLSGILQQLGRSPQSLASGVQNTSTENGTERQVLRSQSTVGSDQFVGSGVKLELDLSSGQTVKLDVQYSQSGMLRHVSMLSAHTMSEQDQALLNQFLTELSDVVESMFKGDTHRDLFNFSHIHGVKQIDLDVQTDDGNGKRQLSFELSQYENGRKEVEALWQQKDRAAGVSEQHGFSLNHSKKEASSSYGAMDYQWIIEQIEAGVGAMGSQSGHPVSSDQTSMQDFFVSGLSVLFGVMKKGQSVMERLGVMPDQANRFLGQTIRALSHEQSKAHPVGAQNFLNALPDFDASFWSKRESSNGSQQAGDYDLSMNISQSSRIVYDEEEEKTYHSQTRRLLVELEQKGEVKSYEYRWQQNEQVDRILQNGNLEESRYWVKGEVQAQTQSRGNLSSQYADYSERSKYSARA